jgi:hypothetical protein
MRVTTTRTPISVSELSTDSDDTEHAEEYTGVKPSG